MKLTQAQTRQLHAVQCNLQRAYNYLQRPDVIGIAVEAKNPLGCDYTIRNPQALETCSGLVRDITPLNKSIGSDIAGLGQALTLINEFMEANQ
jgi:hypothetical protein